ncbi:MAG: hypothetical protein J6T41_00010 [Neisseriaceae bacterium]|nr:hypothetical protein [Neisseriaceae bacterium]
MGFLYLKGFRLPETVFAFVFPKTMCFFIFSGCLKVFIITYFNDKKIATP